MIKRKRRSIYQLLYRDIPIYVGMATYRTRPQEHIDLSLGLTTIRYNKSSEPMYEFIKTHISDISYKFIYEDLEYSEAVEIEEDMIRLIGTRYKGTGPLFNIKYGQRLPSSFYRGYRNPYYGKEHSPEVLDKMRNTRSRSWSLSDETKSKMSKNHRGSTRLEVTELETGEVKVYDTIKSAALDLQSKHPDLSFSVSYVTSMSRIPQEINGLYFLRRL